MNERSSMEIATVIIHEIAHATLGKHYDLYNSSFKNLYFKYINDKGLHNYSHDIMNDYFVNRMANVLYQLNDKLFTDYEDYKLLASEGLFDFNTDQKRELVRIKSTARKNDDNCK